MNIVDFHTHIFPDAIATRAISMLEKEGNVKAFLNGTLADLRRSMVQSGVTKSVLLPVSTKASQVKDINNWAAQINNGDIVAFGTIHPDYEAWQEEIDRMVTLGIRGVKFHPDYQKFYIDEERILPIFEYLIKQGRLIVIHAGVDIGVPPPVHGTPERIARVLDMFPKIRLVAAHLGGYQMWDRVEQHLVGRDIYLDISYTFGDIDTASFTRIIFEHGTDKILFGTDSPWRDQGIELARLKELSLGKNIEEKILYRNAEKLLYN